MKYQTHTSHPYTRFPRLVLTLAAALVCLPPRAGAQAPYCLGGATSCLEHIANVDVAGISKSSGCGNAMGYSNYSASVPPGAMTAGQMYAIVVSNGVPSTQDSVYVWIDWDMNDELGNNANEIYRLATSNGGATFSLTILCPFTIGNGARRLRVRLNNSAISPYGFLPCGTLSSRGEVEDYTVVVSGGTSVDVGPCPARLCTGMSFQVDYTAYGTFLSGNTFTAQLSNAAGSFQAPTPIGFSSSTTSGAITATIPAYAATSGSYRIRVVASNPIVVGPNNGSDVSITPGNPTALVWTAANGPDWNTAGNWDSPCATPSLNDTVYIPDSVALPASIPAVQLSKLRLDHAGGLRLTGNVTLTHSLELARGTVSLGAYTLTLTGTAAVTAAGHDAFVVTDGTGDLRQQFLGSGSRSGTVLFPVGSDSGSYTPVEIQNSGVADEFRVRVSDSVYISGASGAALRGHAVNKTWHIMEAAPGGSTAAVTLHWAGYQELPDLIHRSCFITRYNDTMWVPAGSAGQVAGSDPYSLTATNVTAFSALAVADATSSIPVEITAYRIDYIQSQAVLRWSTTRESNNAGFDIQRRGGVGQNWVRISFVPARGNSGGDYICVDTPPLPGDWQYRIVQIDHDGSRTEYQPLLLTIPGSPQRFTLEQNYPNPATASTTIRYTLAEAQNVLLVLHDLLGRELLNIDDGYRPAGSHSIVVHTSELPSGLYRYTLRTGVSSATRMMTVGVDR